MLFSKRYLTRLKPPVKDDAAPPVLPNPGTYTIDPEPSRLGLVVSYNFVQLAATVMVTFCVVVLPRESVIVQT